MNSSVPGVMAMWIFSVGQSTMGVGFIEGCQRAWLDAQLVQLGDGEDYFDSSFAYQSGVYAFPFAGLVAASAAPAYGFMSYRIADPNPVVWQSTAKITWRAGEDYYNETGQRVGKCNDAGEWPPVDAKKSVVVSSYFWYYEVADIISEDAKRHKSDDDALGHGRDPLQGHSTSEDSKADEPAAAACVLSARAGVAVNPHLFGYNLEAFGTMLPNARQCPL